MMKKVVSKQGIFHQLETCSAFGNRRLPKQISSCKSGAEEPAKPGCAMMLCHHPQVSDI